MNLSSDYWGRTVEQDYRGFVRWEDKGVSGGDWAKNPVSIKTYFEKEGRLCEFYQKPS